MERLLVVGASLAGLRAAEAARAAGFDGVITLVGDEEHLPYDRPPLSKQVLAGDWPEERVVLAAEPHLQALDVELLLGRRAVDLDTIRRRVILHGGDQLVYDRLVIATGAVARTVPSLAGLTGVHTLRTLDDCRALAMSFADASHVVVVGGGFIGAEVAATARKLGREVTIVEQLPTLLLRGLGKELGQVCATMHEDHGVRVRCGVGVSEVRGEPDVEEVVLTDGSRIAADVIVVGVGARPATDWLVGSGIEVDDGIVCDRFGATSASGVFAAGDVARAPVGGDNVAVRQEHWTSASEQGRLAGHNAASPRDHWSPFEDESYFWSDQYNTKIQLVGRPRLDDRVQVVSGSVTERRFAAVYGDGSRVHAAVAFGWPRELARLNRLVQAGATWEEAIVPPQPVTTSYQSSGAPE